MLFFSFYINAKYKLTSFITSPEAYLSNESYKYRKDFRYISYFICSENSYNKAVEEFIKEQTAAQRAS